jgi:hypothetical protein
MTAGTAGQLNHDCGCCKPQSSAPRLMVLKASCTTTSGAASQLHHDFWCCKLELSSMTAGAAGNRAEDGNIMLEHRLEHVLEQRRPP